MSPYICSCWYCSFSGLGKIAWLFQVANHPVAHQLRAIHKIPGTCMYWLSGNVRKLLLFSHPMCSQKPWRQFQNAGGWMLFQIVFVLWILKFSGAEAVWSNISNLSATSGLNKVPGFLINDWLQGFLYRANTLGTSQSVFRLSTVQLLL